jgi:hypothetical protein
MCEGRASWRRNCVVSNFDDRAAFTIDERWEKSVLALIAKVQIGEDEGELSQRAAIK